MVDDPLKRLEEHARQAVPPLEPGFADRLESSLRASHAQAQTTSRRRASGWLPRFGVVFALIALGVYGAFALTARDAGVPVAVIDEDPSPDAGLAVEPPIGAADAAPSPIATVAPTPTTTPTATSSSATATAEVLPPALVDPTSTSVSTPTRGPQPSVVPNEVVPTVVEEPEPAPTTVPSANPVPTMTVTVERATPRPVPSPTPTVQQRPTSVPTPTATAMVEPEPAPIDLSCMTRVSGDAVGVICTWEPPIVSDQALPYGDIAYGDIAHYELWRSRNGGEATIVTRTRPAISSYVDRDVTLGDRVSYVVRGLDSSEEIIAASIRTVVMVTGRG